MLNISTDLSTALAGDNFEYAYIVDLPIDLHYTNHGKDLTIDGTPYTSNGLLVKFAQVNQTQELSLATYSLELSNVDNSVAKAYSSGSFRGLTSTISLVVLVDGVVQGSPIVIYKGTIDSFSIRETDKTSGLSLKLTSHWASYNQKAGRYSSDSLQQDLYPGDRIFKYAHSEQNNIGWGKR